MNDIDDSSASANESNFMDKDGKNGKYKLHIKTNDRFINYKLDTDSDVKYFVYERF